MGKSQETYNKKEKEKKRLKKREDKQQKAEERKANSSTGLDNMIAYVDEFGNITDTPPDPTRKKQKIDLESIDISVRKQEHVDVDPIHKGKIDFFNSSKGFGFIKETESGERYFVHVSGLLQPVVEGDAVSFEIERGPKGMTAVRVKKG